MVRLNGTRRLGLCIYRCSFLVACGLVVGCGSDRLATYPVTVTVKLPNGQPVPGARVSFRSTEHKISARGVAGDDGTCQMTTFERNDGAVAGKHQVAIGPPAVLGDPDDPQPRYPIASRLANFSTSQLEITVSDNEAENSFTLTAAPK